MKIVTIFKVLLLCLLSGSAISQTSVDTFNLLPADTMKYVIEKSGFQLNDNLTVHLNIFADDPNWYDDESLTDFKIVVSNINKIKFPKSFDLIADSQIVKSTFIRRTTFNWNGGQYKISGKIKLFPITDNIVTVVYDVVIIDRFPRYIYVLRGKRDIKKTQ